MTKDQMQDLQINATKMLGDILPKVTDIIAEIDNRNKQKLQVNEIRKIDIIQNYAVELERKGGMPISQICGHMIKVLKGIVSPVHIRRSLAGEYQKYKDANQSAIRLKGSHKVARMPRDYKLEELEAYNKRYLIAIIQYLHNKLQRQRGKN
jgi:hypothetical protein